VSSRVYLCGFYDLLKLISAATSLELTDLRELIEATASYEEEGSYITLSDVTISNIEVLWPLRFES
jgi:hypothetical protein